MSIDDLKPLTAGNMKTLSNLVDMFWKSTQDGSPKDIIKSSYLNLINGYDGLRHLGYDISPYADTINNTTEKMEAIGYR